MSPTYLSSRCCLLSVQVIARPLFDLTLCCTDRFLCPALPHSTTESPYSLFSRTACSFLIASSHSLMTVCPNDCAYQKTQYWLPLLCPHTRPLCCFFSPARACSLCGSGTLPATAGSVVALTAILFDC